MPNDKRFKGPVANNLKRDNGQGPVSASVMAPWMLLSWREVGKPETEDSRSVLGRIVEDDTRYFFTGLTRFLPTG